MSAAAEVAPAVDVAGEIAAREIAVEVLGANLATADDANRSAAALAHVTFDGARVRMMLADAARLGMMRGAL